MIVKHSGLDVPYVKVTTWFRWEPCDDLALLGSLQKLLIFLIEFLYI
jgi:hypothetical protein